MSVVFRRVIYGKPGAADQIVQCLKDGERFLQKHGAEVKIRVLVDHFSGRSDTVVEELEFDDIPAFFTGLGQLMSQPGAAAEHKTLEARMLELVTHAEAEWWRVV